MQQTASTVQHQHTTALPESSLKKKIRRFFFKALLKTRAKRLRPRILDALGDTCTTVLDLGCGDMILTEYMQRTTKLSITALDTVDSNLSQMPLTIYDGDRIPFADRSFDATMVAYVLHHCTDIRAVLKEIKRVSSKRIIILEEIYSNTFAEKMLHLHDFGNRFLSTKMDIPCNFLKIEEWHTLFTELGLRVEKSSRIFQYPFFNMTKQILFELVVE